MPDILIRVPDSIRCCGECPCFYAEHPMRCQADTHRPKRTHGAPYAGKPDWCPAKELPPHGDLIDRDDYIAMMESNCDKNTLLDPYILHVCRGGVKTMPVVVPAERRDADD